MTVQIVGTGDRVLWARQYRGDDNGRPQSIEVSGEDTPKALMALRTGSEVRILFDGAYDPAAIITLEGSNAAFDWARSQARVHTGRTWIHRARAIDQRNLPAIKQPPSDACDHFGGEPEVVRARLAPQKVLWIRTCRAGYNNDSVLSLTDEAGKLLPAPEIKHLDEPRVSMLGQQNLAYDPETRTLTSTTWQRQLGGCGNRAEWVWDGVAFQFAMFSSFDECHEVDARYWPVRYRAPVIDESPRAGR